MVFQKHSTEGGWLGRVDGWMTGESGLVDGWGMWMGGWLRRVDGWMAGRVDGGTLMEAMKLQPCTARPGYSTSRYTIVY